MRLPPVLSWKKGLPGRPVRIIERSAPPPLAYAIGDIHGHYDLLVALEEAIVADARARGVAPLIVVLGDVVDRGPDSRKVIEHLLTPPRGDVERVTLSGNHEATMAEFLRLPAYSHDWLLYGGVETLRSYGIDAGSWSATRPKRQDIAEQLVRLVPQEHERFVADRPYLLRAGKLVFVHAGIDRSKPVSRQDVRDMMWRRPDPAESMEPAPDGLLVVHGHTPGPEVFVSGRRVNLDTGAYAGGPLTAGRFVEGRFDGMLTSR